MPTYTTPRPEIQPVPDFPNGFEVVSTEGPDQGHTLYQGTEQACRIWAAAHHQARRRTNGEW